MEDLTFPNIFSALGASQFISAFCDKRTEHFQQEDRSRFESFFSWDLINGLLTQNMLDEKRLRVVKDSRDMPATFYRRDDERRTIDAKKLTELLGQGCSLAFNRVQHFSPEVRRIALELERWLDQRLNVNAYVSFGNGGAFTSHYDTHDVLVLQVQGDKLWTIYDEPEPHPILEHKVRARHGGRGRPVAMELNLQAGDMLYVPRGVYHQAAVQDGISVHLTFGILTAKGIDFIDEIRARCAREEEFRKDILGLAGADTLAERERAVKTRLHELIDEFSFEAFLEHFSRAREPLDLFQLGPTRDLPPDQVLAPLVRQRDGFDIPVKDDDGLAEKVIDRLVDHDRMKLSELCDSFDGEVGPEAVRSTVNRLVRERLVETL